MLKKIYFYTVNQSLFDTNKKKQSSRGVLLKGVLRNLTKFTGKQLYQRLFFNKVADLRPATLLKKRLWHRCFPVNFVKFLRTPLFTEHLWWLLLNKSKLILEATIIYIKNTKRLSRSLFGEDS